MIWTLTKIELYKTFSKWRSYAGFLLFGLFIPVIIIAAHFSGGMDSASFLAPDEHFYFSGNLYNAFSLSFFILNLIWIHLPFLITVAAGDLFAGESSDGTFRFLLVRPVTRTEFFIAKWLTNFIYTFSLIFFMGFITLGFGLIFEGLGDLFAVNAFYGIAIIDQNEALGFLFKAYFVGAFTMLTISTLALLFSVFVSNPIGPIIGTMGIVIVFYLIEFIDLSFFEAIRPFLFSHYMDTWLMVFFKDISRLDLLRGLAVHGIYIFIFSITAYYYFLKKEIQS